MHDPFNFPTGSSGADHMRTRLGRCLSPGFGICLDIIVRSPMTAIPMTVNSTSRQLSWLILILASGLLTTAPAQSNQTPPAQPVPTIDGGLGRCSLELTVTTADGKPAAAASVKVHIAYGFGGFHKLDLEAGTNLDGKVKFMGLPSRVRRPPAAALEESST